MCCFSGPVRFVENTRIFSRLTGNGTQMLVYSMAYASDRPVAMILPLPIAIPAEESSVRFFNLKNYADFFQDMEASFPYLLPRREYGAGTGGMGGASRTILPVKNVGDFVASFVPTAADFDRLDRQFRIPYTAWAQLPAYRDYSFAVFQLRQTPSQGATVHPMALEFRTRLHDMVFFPTVHIHDGQVHGTEQFDHVLYVQDPRLQNSAKGGFARAADPKILLTSSLHPVGSRLDVRRAQGIVQPDAAGYRLLLRGSLPNRDTLLRMA